MREAAVPGYRLSRAKKSVKVLTTLGLLGILLGLLSAVLLTLAKTGITPSAVRAYYLGESAGTGINALLNPSEPRSFTELAEVTHLHLMGGSVLLFLLCHLLSLCDISENLRISLYSISFGAFLLTFSLPWAIIYLSPFFSNFFGVSILTLIVSLFALSWLPLKEMWWE